MINMSFMKITYENDFYIIQDPSGSCRLELYADEIVALSKAVSALVQNIFKKQNFNIEFSLQNIPDVKISYTVGSMPKIRISKDSSNVYEREFNIREIGVLSTLLDKLSTFCVIIPFLSSTSSPVATEVPRVRKIDKNLDTFLSNEITGNKTDDFPFEFEEPKTKPGDPHPKEAKQESKDVIDLEKDDEPKKCIETVSLTPEEIDAYKTTVLSMLSLREDQVDQECVDTVSKLISDVLNIQNFSITQSVLRQYISSIRTAVTKTTESDSILENPISDKTAKKYPFLATLQKMYDTCTTKEEKLQLFPVALFTESLIGLYEASQILDFSNM